MADIELEHDVMDKALKVKKGPPCAYVVKWNRQTRAIFDKGRKPKQGRRYVLKCIRFDGLHGYFNWEGR